MNQQKNRAFSQKHLLPKVEGNIFQKFQRIKKLEHINYKFMGEY